MVARAESRLGETAYDLLFNNCEHFAFRNESGGLLPGSDATFAGPTFEEWLDASS